MKTLVLVSCLVAVFSAVNNTPKKVTIDANCSKGTPYISGADQLGVGVDLLKIDIKDRIFTLNCKGPNPLTLDGQNKVPDGVSYQWIFESQQEKKTLIAKSVQQYSSFKLRTLNTDINTDDCPEYGFKLGVVAGQLNANVQEINKKLETKTQIYQTMFQKQQTHRVQLDEIDSVTLSDAFIKGLRALPDTYQQDKHTAFLQQFGTHFREAVTLGGYISRVGYTETSYQGSNDDISRNFDNAYASELLKGELSINHLPNDLLHPVVDNTYSQATTLYIPHVEPPRDLNALNNFDNDLYEKPAVVEQRLLNVTALISSKLLPSDLQKKIPQLKKKNINQALKDYLIKSSGCTDQKAINYNPKARIADSSCYYSAFFGYYQQPTGQCSQEFQDQYTLNNPVTGKLTCPSGSTPNQVGIYTFNGCDLQQYFCLRDGIPQKQDDLRQSLLVCQARYLSNVFYSTEDQYYCKDKEQRLYFNIKYDDRQVIYTCTQYWCFLEESNGAENFGNQHEGQCKGYNVDKEKERQSIACDGSCLIRYGKVPLADDCDLNQYICIQNQFDVECVNTA